MTPERWREIQALFDAAVERSEGERDAFLLRACGDDAELRTEVDALLRADAIGSSVLDDTADRALGLATALPEAGARVGAYELLERLGAGGMGEVFAARRAEGGFEQRVAVKLIRAGADSAQVAARFARERQILAGLSHPHIARLLDGGATDDGRPYFVMEHVSGSPIDAYCDAVAAGLSFRLRLLADVCAAVHHAHQCQVIHRDLKPDNIFVTADGSVKLLDFGIARVVDPEEGVAVAMTDPRQRVLTPQYAAPEQVRGEPVTAATDVYALGVLLYRLITGVLPYSTKGVLPSQLERVICGADIPPPSEVSTVLLIPSALDAVCLRALARAPDDRYRSAADLGAALAAIAAPPVQRWQWSSRWIVAAAIVFAALLGFAVGRWTG